MRAARCVRFVLLLLGIIVIAGYPDLRSQSVNSGSAPSGSPSTSAPVRPVIDDYFGTKVADPYRYMENLEAPEVQSWIKSQNESTRAALSSIKAREQMLSRIQALDQSVPQVAARRLPGEIYIIRKILPGETTWKVYVRHGLTGQDKLLIDPAKIALAPVDQGKGANVISGFVVSNNGHYAAVGIVPGGDELHGEIHVIDIFTGRETGDAVARVGAEAWQPYWLPDDKSFVYGRTQELPPNAPPAEVRQKFRSYLHVLGTDTGKDQPVFGYGVVPGIEVDPSLIASVRTQSDSRWALGVLNGSTTPNSAYYIEPVENIGKNAAAWRKVADFSDGVTDISAHEDDLYLLTYQRSPLPGHPD